MFQRFLASCTIAALAIPFIAAGALSVEDFYRGKTVDFVVGYSPGGGFDAYTRAAARFLGKHIPGNPTVVVQNMPGAASLQSVRYLQTRARKDGTQIGMFNRALINHSLMDPKIAVDFRRFTWIGSMSGDFTACYVWKGAKIPRIEDLEKRKVTIGATATTSGGYIDASILRYFVGAGLESVLGYGSAGEIWLAMERGEVDGNCGSWSGLKAQRGSWVSDNKIDVWVQFKGERDPELKDVRTVLELARDDRERDALAFLVGTAPIGYPVIAPPDIPTDRAAALRKALSETLQDPEFLSFAQKANMNIDPVSGEEAEKIVARILAVSPEAVAVAKEMLGQ